MNKYVFYLSAQLSVLLDIVCRIEIDGSNGYSKLFEEPPNCVTPPQHNYPSDCVFYQFIIYLSMSC